MFAIFFIDYFLGQALDQLVIVLVVLVLGLIGAKLLKARGVKLPSFARPSPASVDQCAAAREYLDLRPRCSDLDQVPPHELAAALKRRIDRDKAAAAARQQEAAFFASVEDLLSTVKAAPPGYVVPTAAPAAAPAAAAAP